MGVNSFRLDVMLGAMSNKKDKKELNNSTLANVKKEMARRESRE
jgi:hypothetical protein